MNDQPETITISKTEYENMQARIDWLTERVRLLTKQKFGPSSEKIIGNELAEQLGMLFNETEWTPDISAKAEKITVKEYTRRSGNVMDIIPEGLPVEKIEHRLSEEERICEECGTVMEEIGHEVRRTLVILPAPVKVREEWFYTYACRKCEKENIRTPMKRAQVPAVIPGSFASPEAIAHIMTQKFVMYSPLYRQAQELQRNGIRLSRQTMSNWVLRASQDWLKPICDELHRRLVKSKVLHADETTLQVLREPGKTAQSTSYMWLYRTSGDTDKPIVLYEYTTDRKSENAERFLTGFSGYLHTDGYQGYHTLPAEITVVGCMAHARRKLIEALNAVPKDQRNTCTAQVGLVFMRELYDIEDNLRGLPVKEIHRLRQEQAKPVFEAMLSWAKTVTAPEKSHLGGAVKYLREQESYLKRYLEDGRLEIDNNRAERSIKPFVMGRKNFLFANTPCGAESGAVVYSLIQTAIENGLDPYRYLVYIFRNAPVLFETTNDWITPLLPENVPEECKFCGDNVKTTAVDVP